MNKQPGPIAKLLDGEDFSAKLKAEIKLAKTIQNSLSPIDDIYWNTIALNSSYIPAEELGGDFYDLLRLNDNEYIIYVADVAGHGIHTAMLAVYMRERVKININAAIEGTGKLLPKLVHDFCKLNLDDTIYITMVLCKYVKSSHELIISNAGHSCFPLIVRKGGRTETIPARGIPICKIAEGENYNEETTGILPGDRLVLFTDGIILGAGGAKDSFGLEAIKTLAGKYNEYVGNRLAGKIMDESCCSFVNKKDDRSIIVADILS